MAPHSLARKHTISLLFLALLIGPGVSLEADTGDSATFRISAVRTDGNIALTGKLDDSRWLLAQPVELRYEIQPGENTPATQRTSARILYNSDYVYFGFDCKDTGPSDIRAHISDRDKTSTDDWVGIILDTYGDYQRAYEFMVNPFGIQADFMRTRSSDFMHGGTNEDASFDLVWESAAAITDSGWTAEMAIPLKSLRFPSKPDQRWVVEFIRNYPRESRIQTSWVPLDRNNPCLLCQAGIIEGIRDVETTTSVDLLPYVVGQQSGSTDDDSDPESAFKDGKVSGRAGVGLRYSPTPDLAVEGVANPDFSQVESDATQISVNSTFALFYPEKRPFFLPGTDLFQNRVQTFYSRTINNPSGAARILGKTGSLSFTYLAALDRNTPYIIPGEETSDYVPTDLRSASNVARARYDFGSESYIGGIITTRNSTAAHNYVGGLDWNYMFWGNYSFGGELYYSHTRELNDTAAFSGSRVFGTTGHDATFNGEQYPGSAAWLVFRRNAREYSFGVMYSDEAPTFQAQDGFVPSNDLRTLMVQQQYVFYPTGALIDSWSAGLVGAFHYNYDGIRKEKWAEPVVYVQFKGQTELRIQYLLVNDELFKGTQFDKINRTEIEVTSRPASELTLSFNGAFGKFIKRTDPADMGRGHNISLTAVIRPTSRLEVDLSYSRARLSSATTGELFYDGYITRATGIVQFTKEAFLRVIGQYDEFSKSFDIYPLVSYKINPYTIFYAGSTYTLLDYGDPFGIRQTARQFFLKLQYLIRG